MPPSVLVLHLKRFDVLRDTKVMTKNILFTDTVYNALYQFLTISLVFVLVSHILQLSTRVAVQSSELDIAEFTRSSNNINKETGEVNGHSHSNGGVPFPFQSPIVSGLEGGSGGSGGSGVDKNGSSSSQKSALSAADTLYDLQGLVSHSGTLHGVRLRRILIMLH